MSRIKMESRTIMQNGTRTYGTQHSLSQVYPKAKSTYESLGRKVLIYYCLRADTKQGCTRHRAEYRKVANVCSAALHSARGKRAPANSSCQRHCLRHSTTHARGAMPVCVGVEHPRIPFTFTFHFMYLYLL